MRRTVCSCVCSCVCMHTSFYIKRSLLCVCMCKAKCVHFMLMWTFPYVHLCAHTCMTVCASMSANRSSPVRILTPSFHRIVSQSQAADGFQVPAGLTRNSRERKREVLLPRSRFSRTPSSTFKTLHAHLRPQRALCLL